jgi:hypothetical protein
MAINREEARVILGVDVSAVAQKLSTATAQFRKFAGGLGGILSGGALIAGMSKAIDHAEQLTNLAQSLGISTDFLQDLQNVAIASGQSREQVQKMLETFTRTLKSGSDIEKAFNGLADQIAGIRDPAERARLAVEKFGKSGVEMLPILMNGSKGLQEMAASFNKLSEAEIKSLNRADEQIDSFNNKVYVGYGRFVGWVETQTSFLGKVFGFWAENNPLSTGSFYKSVAQAMEMQSKEADAVKERVALGKKLAAEAERQKKIEEFRANLLKENQRINAEMVKKSDAIRQQQKAITEEIGRSVDKARELRDQYFSILRGMSDTSLSDAFSITDSVRGPLDLAPLELSNAQMDALDRARVLERDAKQARIEGNTGLADKLMLERQGIIGGLGFLPEGERNPFAGLQKEAAELNANMKTLVEKASAAGLKVQLTNID